ncbi:MAG: histidine--tRNA ligase family protein [Dehalococcoidales bacterium]|nr:histidine--tRNA ligase family protein [Dehalococcoidales bacterium]
MKIQRAKGMRDLTPAEMRVFRFVEGVCRDCFQKWGYEEVRTPTIEYLHLFTSAGTLTPGRLGKVYSFLDWDGWSGERVVLRPDGTIPVARLYTESLHSRKIARLFYAANIFIFEESPERPRERWQCGAELIGAGTPLADAELIAMALEVLERLGLDGVEVRLSHAGLVQSLLKKLGLSPEAQHRVFDRILDGDAQALDELGKQSPDLSNAVRPLLCLNGESASFLRNQLVLLRHSLPDVCPCVEDFLRTVTLLDELGIRYRISLASGAGFEYYTGVIFQIFVRGEKVGGGGRYDALIPSMGGGDIPACGFALYTDRLMEIVPKERCGAQERGKVLVRVLVSAMAPRAFALADELRRAGYVAEIDLDGGGRGQWVVEVGGGPSPFTLTGESVALGQSFGEAGDVIRCLEERSGR